MRSSRRIVVLGGTGFVGARLLARLAPQADQLLVLSRQREQHREIELLPKVEVRSCNVYDQAQLGRAFAGMDTVINLVGILNESGRSGRGFERAHVELTASILAAAEQSGVKRLLQMSSLGAGRGESHYLKTRGAAEARVRASKLDWTIFRPSVIFGPGDGLFCRFAALLPLLPGVLPLARAAARMQPVYVLDVVEAMARALNNPDTIGQTLELGGPRPWTLSEIVQYAAQQIGRPTRVLALPDLLGRLQGWMFDWLPLPLKPFSADNFKSLQLDSVTSRQDLQALGIQPTAVEAVVPGYLGSLQHQHQLDGWRKRIS